MIWRNAILEYNPVTEQWQEVGKMKEAKAVPAVSLVTLNHYAAWCE